MSVLRTERGTAVVEAPFAICIVLLLVMGITTLAQVVWTHLDLASAVQTTTRYASHVDYDPTAVDDPGARRRTAAQIEQWAVEVADEAGVTVDDVTVVGRHLPSGVEADPAALVSGDEITVTVTKRVSNPLYRVAAIVTNTASSVLGAGDVFDPDGVGIKAEAATYVE